MHKTQLNIGSRCKYRQLSLQSEHAEHWKNSPFQARVFNALGVEKYTDEELHDVFEFLVNDNGEKTEFLYKYEVQDKFETLLKGTIPQREIDEFVDKFWEYETQPLQGNREDQEVECITEVEFISRIRELGQSTDSRMMPLAAIFLASGISIGVIIPVMPQLAQVLDMSTAQYGTVVGAFALTKMMGNVPAAMAVERFGCKPILAGTIVTLGFAIGGIGLVDTYEGLIMCRFAGGACIAGFVSAAFVYLADISNPLNRGSTFAPPSTAFTAGTALGPALGGGKSQYFSLPMIKFS